MSYLQFFSNVYHFLLHISPFTYILYYFVFIYHYSVFVHQVLNHFFNKKISDINSNSRETWSSIFWVGKTKCWDTLSRSALGGSGQKEYQHLGQGRSFILPFHRLLDNTENGMVECHNPGNNWSHPQIPTQTSDSIHEFPPPLHACPPSQGEASAKHQCSGVKRFPV